MIGWLGHGTVIGCYATGNVILPASYAVGGLVGGAPGRSTVKLSYATGNVSGTNNIGGLIGYNEDWGSNPGGVVEYSYATGNVTGTGSNVGGLVGGLGYSTTKHSFATGSVTGTGVAGGLAGGCGKLFEDVYAKGSVSGRTGVGGLVGYGCDYLIRRAYSLGNVTVTGVSSSSAGGLLGYGAGGTGAISGAFSFGSVQSNTTIALNTGLVVGTLGSTSTAGFTPVAYLDTATTTNSAGGTITPSSFATAQPESYFKGPLSVSGVAEQIYYGWNFDTVWLKNNNALPVLRCPNVEPAGWPFNCDTTWYASQL